MKKTYKYMFILALAGLIPLGALAGASASSMEASLERAVAEGTARASQQASRRIVPVQTIWNRCDVYQSRRRVSRIGGGREKVRVDYNCKDVSTQCSAVVAERKAYISQSCYYAEKKEDQKLYFKSSRITYANGRTVSLLPSQMNTQAGYVIFTLK